MPSNFSQLFPQCHRAKGALGVTVSLEVGLQIIARFSGFETRISAISIRRRCSPDGYRWALLVLALLQTSGVEVTTHSHQKHMKPKPKKGAGRKGPMDIDFLHGLKKEAETGNFKK